MALLSILYLHGPSLGGLGFWNGLGRPDVCARITGVRAGFWEGSDYARAECTEIITRQVRALAVSLTILVTFLTLTVALTVLCVHCCLMPRRGGPGCGTASGSGSGSGPSASTTASRTCATSRSGGTSARTART